MIKSAIIRNEWESFLIKLFVEDTIGGISFYLKKSKVF
jgi:hypothetical protein